ncbi:MAG TPA: ROK family transcriptional regulator [Anaerolineaceae bacterium]
MNYIRTITPSQMRIINRSAILDLVRRESPISRSTIAEKLDVSLPTVMRIVDELVEEGLVRLLGATEWSGGRRRSLIEFNAHGQVMIGLDLGGVKLYGAVADMGGQVLREATVPHPPACGEEGYAQVTGLIEELLVGASQAGVAIRGIGVGAPGLTDYEQGIVRWSPVFEWRDFPLRQRLTERFRLPVIVDNDVNLSALGEVWFGSEQNAAKLVLISVGTGIGAGIVIDGAIYRGAHQAAGEIGYMLPGREYLNTTATGLGPLEYLAAGTGIATRARKALAGQLSEQALEALQADDVFEAYGRGESWSAAVIEETADYLAMAVSSVALCLDPDVIVLGGDLSHRFGALVEPVLARVRGTLPASTRLAASTLGRRAAVMGAVTNVLHHTADFYALRSMA